MRIIKIIEEKLASVIYEELNSLLYLEYLNVGNEDIDDYRIKQLIALLYSSDAYTKVHCENVSYYSIMLANALNLPSEEINRIKLGAILHDIGKIVIPNPILTKSSYLNDLEYEIIKRHPIVGEKILSIFDLQDFKDIIRSHHERFDGKGYPDGLIGEKIPLSARIVAIADTFDAMINHRPYGRLKTINQAVEELCNVAGTQLDPSLVNEFVKLVSGTLEQNIDFSSKKLVKEDKYAKKKKTC